MEAATPEASTVSTKRTAWTRVCMLAGALVVGVIVQRGVLHHMRVLETAAQSDPIGARRQLAGELRVGGLGLFGLTGLLGAWFVVLSVRARRIGRFPPPGTSSWTAPRRVLSGPAARRMAVVGIVLGVVLLAASIAGAALTWRMADVLLACRAPVTAR